MFFRSRTKTKKFLVVIQQERVFSLILYAVPTHISISGDLRSFMRQLAFRLDPLACTFIQVKLKAMKVILAYLV